MKQSGHRAAEREQDDIRKTRAFALKLQSSFVHEGSNPKRRWIKITRQNNQAISNG